MIGPTKEGANEEYVERNVKDGRSQIDKPIGDERCDANEEKVVPQILALAFNLFTKPFDTGFCKVVDDGFSDEIGSKEGT